MLIEDELRRSGLGGPFVLGDDVEPFLCPRREGEEVCGEEGRAVEEAVLIERRCSECDRETLLFVEGGSGAGGVGSGNTSSGAGSVIAL